MKKLIKNEYMLNRIFTPSETLTKILKKRGMSQAEFDKKANSLIKVIDKIKNGKGPSSLETVIQFEQVLDITADFWKQMETRCRTFLAHSKENH